MVIREAIAVTAERLQENEQKHAKNAFFLCFSDNLPDQTLMSWEISDLLVLFTAMKNNSCKTLLPL
jgi:hypothetical protein